MAWDYDEWARKLDKGEINDDQFLAAVEKHCKHVRDKDLAWHGDKWYESCERCGMVMASGVRKTPAASGTGSAKVVKSGCAVVAVLLLGAIVVAYGLLDLVTS